MRIFQYIFVLIILRYTQKLTIRQGGRFLSPSLPLDQRNCLHPYILHHCPDFRLKKGPEHIISYIHQAYSIPLKFTDCIEPFLVRGNVLELDVESDECLCLLKEEGPEQWRDLRVGFVFEGERSMFSSV